MKRMKLYGGRGREVDVFQKEDLKSLEEHGVFAEATDKWRTDWERDGAPTGGTCVGGNGLAIWYVGPRKRKPERLIVARPPHFGTDCEAHYTRALAYLREVLDTEDVSYHPGWMD